MIVVMVIGRILMERASSSTVSGEHESASLHGSARFAEPDEIKKMGLLRGKGVVVGGLEDKLKGTTMLRHDGPEHVLAFAPTRSGKGVGVVIPTLLTWPGSTIVLDIKGENYAKTSGWRASQGQNVFYFEPSAEEGSARYNPLQEIRLGTDHQIGDCMNVAKMIIDTSGKGLKDFWEQEGFSWLTTPFFMCFTVFAMKKSAQPVLRMFCSSSLWATIQTPVMLQSSWMSWLRPKPKARKTKMVLKNCFLIWKAMSMGMRGQTTR
ncbi:type IV secretory system conjugative DNA transfer family protein [Pseudovibrio denitrificans]|uniref:type IV secretory system conjugative DNA transfer family protein n=1 Tax=Pseudovibrio denitrificans TaxID=258256 RepID=UPI0006CF6A7D|nr:type IV secretory system conjugative DNA transfer family protein [Pseudovibrio denitrificans]